MNEEILKEAVNFGATIGNRWNKYTDGGERNLKAIKIKLKKI